MTDNQYTPENNDPQFDDESTSSTDPISNYVMDYWNFVERAAPTAVRTVRDIYRVWFKASHSAIDAQSKMLERMGYDTRLIQESANLSRQVLTAMEEAQSSASDATLDTTRKISGMMRDAVRAQKTDPQA